MTTPEGQLLKDAIAWLERAGYRNLSKKRPANVDRGPGSFWRMSLGPVYRGGGAGSQALPAPNPMAGFPDLAGTLHTVAGLMWAIELKAPTSGELRPKQRLWLARLTRAGISCAVIRTTSGLARAIQRFEEGAKTCSGSSAPSIDGSRVVHGNAWARPIG